ncbi:hypothetical protein [Tumebacillus permanentifrigoris]|uniref:Uncharacterized protein n=1 Tax=Tumebacillus permanentifrigoris TaxID=378543 RepID=A0A316D647_9BACL|nr:hypothetical protein [Tumebacillus permanentifrigoris]PWK10206.1 hypothetical protein C7459_11227 [Tumebacillus permanentifrigoris]
MNIGLYRKVAAKASELHHRQLKMGNDEKAAGAKRIHDRFVQKISEASSAK